MLFASDGPATLNKITTVVKVFKPIWLEPKGLRKVAGQNAAGFLFARFIVLNTVRKFKSQKDKETKKETETTLLSRFVKRSSVASTVQIKPKPLKV